MHDPGDSAASTKTERVLEAQMAAHQGDPERVAALARTKAFKRSWIELAATLVAIRDRGTWKRWGFDDFDDYHSKELHLRRSTVDKLTASYGFLRANAPRLIREPAHPQSGEGIRLADDLPIPSIEAVQYVVRAEERGAIGAGDLAEMKRAAFEEGATVPALARRYREVAFPVDDEEKQGKLRGQLLVAARKLADLVAEPEARVPRQLAEKVELLMGELAQALG
jgi:hypothetical protein